MILLRIIVKDIEELREEEGLESRRTYTVFMHLIVVNEIHSRDEERCYLLNNMV